jgi:hypothetical protein
MPEYQHIHGGEVVLEPGRDGVVRPRYRGGRWLKFGVPVSSGAYKSLLHSLGKADGQSWGHHPHWGFVRQGP